MSRIPSRAAVARARALAATGDPEALERLAYVYRTRRGARRDLRRALGYALRAAALGHPESLFNAGDMYELGEGTRATTTAPDTSTSGPPRLDTPTPW